MFQSGGLSNWSELMKRCATTHLVAVAVCACTFVAQAASAEDRSLTREEAAKLGVTVELSEPKPKVVFATVRFAASPREAELVIRDGNERWIANAAVAVGDKACSLWLAQEYVAKSYFR